MALLFDDVDRAKINETYALVHKLNEKVDLLIKVCVLIQDKQNKPFRNRQRTTLHNLRKKLAEQQHYIRELEKELKLS